MGTSHLVAPLSVDNKTPYLDWLSDAARSIYMLGYKMHTLQQSLRLFNQIPYRMHCDIPGWDGGAPIIRLMGEHTQFASVSPMHAHVIAKAYAVVCRVVVEGRHQYGGAIAGGHVMTWKKICNRMPDAIFDTYSADVRIYVCPHIRGKHGKT